MEIIDKAIVVTLSLEEVTAVELAITYLLDQDGTHPRWVETLTPVRQALRKELDVEDYDDWEIEVDEDWTPDV